MADPSNASSSKQGGDKENRTRTRASSDQRRQRRVWNRNTGSSMRVTSNSSRYCGAGEQNRTRPSASSGQLCWRRKQNKSGTSSSLMADQSNSSRNNAAGEENRTTMEKDGSSMANPSNSPGNNVGGEENRPPSFSSSSRSVYPPSSPSTNLEAAATATDVAAAAVDTATAVASTAYCYHYHPPLYPSSSIPVLPVPAACPPPLDLGAAHGYSMLVCSSDPQFVQFMWQRNEDYLEELISRIVANRTIFFHIAQHPRGSSHLEMLIGRSREVAEIIFPAVSDFFLCLMNHQCGFRVVITTLIAIDQPDREELYRLTEQHALNLARNPIGYLPLIDVIHIVTGQYRNRILNLIINNFRDLSIDPFGASVSLHVLDLCDQRLTRIIGHQLYGYYTGLSSQSVGSCIVERVLRWHWTLVADDLLTNGVHELPLLANNPFGNFIVQRIMDISYRYDRGRYGRIVSILKPWINILRRGEHSGHVCLLFNRP